MIWANEYFREQAQADALDQLRKSDAMLMGRHTYEMFAATSPDETSNYAQAMNNIRKYVFSSTLQKAEWKNSVIIRGDVVDAVARLKEGDQDLIMYGHGPLGQALLRHPLLDELRLWLHPLLLGSGKPLFQEGEQARLELVGTRTLETGVVVLIYHPSAI